MDMTSPVERDIGFAHREVAIDFSYKQNNDEDNDDDDDDDNDSDQLISVTMQGRGLTVSTASLFIVGEIAGTGVLALPRAVEDTGWIGILCILVTAITAGYTGVLLANSWSILQERWPEYRSHVRDPYPAIAYRAFGKWGRVMVSVCNHITLFGAGVVFTLLASQNIQSLLSNLNVSISFCYWLMIICAALAPLSWLGTPKDFWLLAGGAMLSTGIACLMVCIRIIVDLPKSDVPHPGPSFHSFFMSLGVFTWAFSGHPIFPTLQNDMHNPHKFKKSIMIAFTGILCMYLPVSILGNIAYGGNVHDNVLLDLPSGPVQYIVQILITLHLLCAFVIVLNPLCQELEKWLKVPKHFTLYRVITRSLMMVAVLFIGETVPHFGAVLSLFGSSTLMLLTFILPCLFYERLCSMRNQKWEVKEVKLHHRVIHIEIVCLGIVAMGVGTYAAIYNMTGLTVPCYVNITAATG